MSRKKRLDHILLAGNYVKSQREAEALILAGKVYVSETRADKPGTLYPEDIIPKIKYPPTFVSRGGIKLEGALKQLKINPAGWICADIGASSGGFTDCLLKYGASHIFAVDVAYGQLDWKLRNDPRVTVLERLNVRKLCPDHIDKPLDFAVFDTSFISLQKVIPPVLPFFKSITKILALVKPQFELPKDKVGSGGIVREEKLQAEAVERVTSFAKHIGLETIGIVPSSIKGPKGNQEYLVYLSSSSLLR